MPAAGGLSGGAGVLAEGGGVIRTALLLTLGLSPYALVPWFGLSGQMPLEVLLIMVLLIMVLVMLGWWGWRGSGARSGWI